MRKFMFAAIAGAVLAVSVAGGTGLLPVSPIMNAGFELYAETNGEGGYFDRALYWSHGFGSNAEFSDFDGDGDREAAVPADMAASNHNFWQSTLPPLQIVTTNFDRFEFTVESGTVSPEANNQIGFALSPLDSQHPFVGNFWEGAVMFRANDMAIGPTGRVSMDPATQGEIICPDWPPCFNFKAAFDAAQTVAEKRSILGRARIVQVSFWNFNRQQSGNVVIDDVALLGATTVAEEIAIGNLNPNPCEACLE